MESTNTWKIVAAALNKYYSFTNPFGVEWTIWYLRESYTAILCANLPLTWPLLQRIFKLKNWSYASHGATRYYGPHSRPGGPLSAIRSNIPGQRIQSAPASHKGSLRRTESQEKIYENSGRLMIYQNTEISVQTSSVTEMGILSSPKSQTSIDADAKTSRSSSSDRT